MLQQLIHNGIVVPEPPTPLGLTIRVRGQMVALTPKQEEMALAWARKKDTPYVQDAKFAENFLHDFSAALGIEPDLTLAEVDFTPCNEVVEQERAAKERLTKEERKALAAERKVEREELRARYGFAIVNGQRVELGTYMTEPSGIFMGRGEHPLRGRWKEGAAQRDITLNLSPDAPRPEGDWAEIVWQPDSMWVARWVDKLGDKLKYIWLSDTAPLKQRREASKFDKAKRLDDKLDLVRAHIQDGLVDPAERRRMLATVCALIDVLCLRVGDEKDPDEADTVGATTLRPEHVTLCNDGTVEFRFLGKDSVEWHKKVTLSQELRDNLEERIANARPSKTGGAGGKPQLFPDITSHDVNAYLSSIQPGLTAKVFRTHHATNAVATSLKRSGVKASSPEYAKWEAVNRANLVAAELCNHTKKEAASYASSQQRYAARVQGARERLKDARDKARVERKALTTLRQEGRDAVAAAATPEAADKLRKRYATRIERQQKKVTAAEERTERARLALEKINVQAAIAREKRAWNLGTSLKSYIDPRVFHQWGQKVEYDVLGRYYPTILQRKFAWVRTLDARPVGDDTTDVIVRICMASDLPQVAALFQAVNAVNPQAGLPEEAEAIGRRYLPSLEGDWREPLIMLDTDEQALGFVVIGPEWTDGTADRLDLFAVLHPAGVSPEAVQRLADEVRHAILTHQAHNPKRDIVPLPQTEAWFPLAQDLVIALELAPEEEDEEAESLALEDEEQLVEEA